jgi:VWFA-related protein
MKAAMVTRVAIASVLFPIVVSLTAAAQTQEPARQLPRMGGETIDVSIVNVDVVVTDRKGNRVTGLTKNDFEIAEDGKPQAISNFAEYGGGAGAEPSISASHVEAAGTTTATTAAPPRSLIIFVDDLHLPPFKLNPVFASLKKTLHMLVRPEDSAMIVRWRYKMTIEQPFTSNLALLDAAVDRAAHASTMGAQPDTGTRAVSEQSNLLEFMEYAAKQAGTTFVPDSDEATQMFDLMASADIIKWEITEKINALNALMAGLPPQSKKAMVFLSNRMSEFAGAEKVYAGNSRDPLTFEYRDRYNMKKVMQSLIDAASARGVTIYTMYPTGLGTRADNNPSLNGDQAMAHQNFGTSNYKTLGNELVPLEIIARSTGGTLHWSSDDVAKALPAIRDDFESYYSLGYRVPPRHENRRHHVAVTVKNRAWTVRTRTETIEQSDEATIQDRVVAALYSDNVPQTIPLDLQLGTIRRKGRLHFVIPMKVVIPVSHLFTVADGAAKKGAFTVYITSSHTVGAVGEVTKQTVPFTIPPEKAGVETFTYAFDLLTDFNTSRVVVALVDDTSREMGIARADVTPEQLAKAQ